MEPLLEFAGDYWWLIFPLSGAFAAWGDSLSKASKRRHKRKVELYKIRYQNQQTSQTQPDEVKALMGTHDAVNQQWLDYELDVGKLIDFPMMTDVREPLTVAFLRAKREADALRPANPDSVSAERCAEYRAAVNDYEVAFSVAESEARRIRAGSFSDVERQRLAKARKLINIAVDAAASPAERQAAYRRARRELDGLIVLPDRAVNRIEEQVARALERGRGPATS
ncbi:hypothetical protein BJ994_000890 [Arthrobacter pigmenti]|uniref:Uncharacterized protein n=1 Tax=Arthrobacter pigmenti TaxID=271432 RepID=A0A846RNB4_9MICC|nr:hypothetical protein [Arthrobacter pigmenti]